MVKIYECGQTQDYFYYTEEKFEHAENSFTVKGANTIEEVIAFCEEGRDKGWGFIPNASWKVLEMSKDAGKVQALAEEDGLAFPCATSFIFAKIADLPEAMREEVQDILAHS